MRILTLLTIFILAFSTEVKAGFFDDNDFDGSDLASFIMAYNSISGTSAYNPDCDLAGDGDVDDVDLGGFCLFFGRNDLQKPLAVNEISNRGGTVEVLDYNSELYGTMVEFFENIFDITSCIFIFKAPESYLPIEPNLVLSKVIELKASEPLKGNAYVTIPLSSSNYEQSSVIIKRYDTKSRSLESVPAIGLDTSNNRAVFEINKFSYFYAVSSQGKIQNMPSYASTGFSSSFDGLNNHVVHSENYFNQYGRSIYDHGICSTFTNFSLWYYKSKKQSNGALNCFWNERNTVFAISDAYLEMPIFSLVQWEQKFQYALSTKSGIVFYIMEQINSGIPVPLDLVSIKHSVIVMSYSMNSNSVMFVVYDPNFPREPQGLSVNLTNYEITYTIYANYDFYYQRQKIEKIRPYYVGDSLNEEFTSILLFYPADNWCWRDADGDGVMDINDNCLGLSNNNQADSDNDKIGDSCDNCIEVPNSRQTDTNSDGIGVSCDTGMLDGLVAYFPFNGNSNDLSGYNNNASFYGAPALSPNRFGTSNSAYYFDGNDGMIVANSSTLGINNFSNGYSVSCWIMPTVVTNEYQVIVSKNTNAFQLRLRNGNYFEACQMQSDGSTVCGFYDLNASPLAVNTWYHLVVTWNNNLKSWLIFQNGVLKYPNFIEGLSAITDSDLTFGKDGSYNRWFFNGKIDDIRIYNRALKLSEIFALYQSQN